MHEIGAIVVCTTLSPTNPEGLILGEDYQVKGRSSHEGNMIYSVEDSEGKIFYSTDHFKTIKGGKKGMQESLRVFEVRVSGDSSKQELEINLGDTFQELGITPKDIFGEVEMKVIEALVLKSIGTLLKKFMGE